METCEAIIVTGINAGHRCTCAPRNPDVKRCTRHLNSLELHGPYETARNELKAKLYTGPLNKLNKEHKSNQITLDEFNDRCKKLTKLYDVENLDLINKQREEIDRTGIDPDGPAKHRKIQKKRERRVQQVQRIQQLRLNQVLPDPYLQPYDALRGDRVADVNNNIRDFAADSQNIHTTVAVKQTQEIIRTILEIPVPVEYRWTPDVCSQTPGEIISACKLKQQAVLQMMMKYTSDETIYEMENGIYGKTLDAVWQFVKYSDDKECLIKTLKTELEDNIGMCAQGNLTRLANVLVGYLDGIKPVESSAEALQNGMANLMKNSNTEDRIYKAAELLRQHGIPVAEWEDWLEPLAEEREFTIEGTNVLVH